MAAVAQAESMPRRRTVVEMAPPVLLGVVVSGFWLYLGVLDLIGVEPRPAITGVYYTLLGSAMVFLAWRARETIAERMRVGSRLAVAWAILAGALAAWFLTNVALLSSGTVARNAAALLLLSSLPAALVALSLTRAQMRVAAAVLVALGTGLALISLVSLIADPARSARFSPIDELDPISAAQVTALGAIVLLTWHFGTTRLRTLQIVVGTLLVATTVIPGSRGALLALLFAYLVLAVLSWRRDWLVLVLTIVLGLGAGTFGSAVSGSDFYYSVDVPWLEGRIAPPEDGTDFTGERTDPGSLNQEPISTLAIRRYLISKAIRESFDNPLVGNGVGMLVDDSPDTLRMVRAERIAADVKTHPHNVLVESFYSLGILGLVLFTALLALSGYALARVVRRDPVSLAVRFAFAFAAVAVVNSSISGEIGSDADLWIVMALAVALYADLGRATSTR